MGNASTKKISVDGSKRTVKSLASDKSRKSFVSAKSEKSMKSFMTHGSRTSTQTVSVTCRNCKLNEASYVRKFDHTKLPKEYFHEPDPTLKTMLEISSVEIYPEYWIHLPDHLKLTRYDFKVCDECYAKLISYPTNAWNYWSLIE